MIKIQGTAVEENLNQAQTFCKPHMPHNTYIPFPEHYMFITLLLTISHKSYRLMLAPKRLGTRSYQGNIIPF